MKEADKKFKAIEVKEGKDKDALNKANRKMIDQYVQDKHDEIKLFDEAAPDVSGSANGDPVKE